MKETAYKLNVKRGSTDEIRVKKYLKEKGIEFVESTGVLGSVYIDFSGVDKEEIKMIKKDLDLVPQTVFYTFRELMEDGE